MELELLLYSSKSTCLPLFLSSSSSCSKSPFLLKPKQSLKNPHLSLSQKSQFWGNSLVLHGAASGNLTKTTHVPFGPICAAAVKRRKELPFDSVIQKDKKLKLVLKIRKILVSQPDRVMSLRELGRYRRELVLQKKRRFIALLKKFPAMFEIIVEEGVYSLQFKLTPEAERLYFEELKVMNEMEDLLVRILLEKIAHLRNDLGLPLEFRDTICHRYPQFFKVVATARGPALELTHWDPELAVSAAELSEEENRVREIEEKDLIIDRPIKRICLFRDIPYISPYSDFSGLRSGTIEKEKHACAVVDEILSLTVEKRTLVDHLTHFREEFKFSQEVRGMLIRHPDMFYVSLKGDRDSVFLREAYRDSQLIDKDRLPGAPRTEADGAKGSDEATDGTLEEGQEWSGDDDEFNDDEHDDEDDWSDEDDDAPPNFDEDGKTSNIGVSKPVKQEGSSRENDGKVLVSVLQDGRPRERW
ncbi:protein ROOT PRIMORDIUM DEFECTIVE 1 [Pyrus ussuriensis x Pyrus communis]|uniref:Protein ROOT PRIMORDIUM DEFECTIVE 1 n=1 Tax=Pyrus ussuriensis x Pyrus communis TaxID=2448454 RepID=A0A5N5FKQ3_9ROSA|nr:protein ROOT PRIMORDIUM DEFECTIVE 1 [Pyrus ussuriensis x Pyrus communis]